VKAYLLVFDRSQITRESMVKIINKTSAIENWHAFFDNTLCLASEKDARTLSRLLHNECPQLRFLVTEVKRDNKGGWLPKSIWTFLNHPESINISSDA